MIKNAVASIKAKANVVAQVKTHRVAAAKIMAVNAAANKHHI
jgi:hypothetical protein